MVDYSTKRLKPHALTIGLVGGSGTGKTEVSTMLTTFEAGQIIAKAKGKTNSSLQAKRIIYSQRFEEKQELLVAVKKKETIYSRSEYKHALINAITKVVIKRGKQASVDQIEVENDFKDFLHQELDTDVNLYKLN